MKWEARCEDSLSYSVGRDVAVVSQRPGSWGDSGPGRTEMEVGKGSCKEREEEGVRLTRAMRDVEMQS